MTPNARSTILSNKKAPAPWMRPGAWTDLTRRPIMSHSIRSLRPGDPVPDSEPRRYINDQGYYRLRWRIGVGEYVEAYEHRVFDGRVTTAPHVHHRNGVKTDNRPENLLETDPATHLAHHRRIDRAEVVRLYRSGFSTPEVGAELGCDAAQVYRILIAEGVTPRSIGESLRLDVDPETVRYLHSKGVRARRIAKALGVSATPVERIIGEMGLRPHRTGRPTKREAEIARQAIDSLEVS